MDETEPGGAEARPPFHPQPRMEGAGLVLRPAEAGDWAALFAIGSDPAVWAGHPDRDRWREDRFRAYFEDGLASKAALTAVSRRDGAVMGWSRYSDAFVAPGEIEIGWTFLGRAWWGGAANAEMKGLMLAHAFRSVDRVLFRIGESNHRSRRAAEKIGARLLADRPAPSPQPGTPYLFYAIERRDFPARPA